MLEGILMAIAIFVGIPAGAMVVYLAIERYYDRQIVRDSVRCSECGTTETNVLSIVNDNVICANCHRDRLFA